MCRAQLWAESVGVPHTHIQHHNHLERIVTGDETWTHHSEPESKHQSIDWKHRHSATKKKFKMHSTTGNLMLTVFGTLSRDWLNNEHCALQCDELKPAIRNQ